VNILYVSFKKGWGGIKSWMVRTARGLEKRGHSVFIVSHPSSLLNPDNYPDLQITLMAPGPNFNLLRVWHIYKLIRKHKIDLVLVNIQKEVFAGGWAAYMAGVPCVRRIGSADDINRRIKRRQRRLIYHNIIPGNYVFQKAKETNAWLQKKDFTTIYNGASLPQNDNRGQASKREAWNIAPDLLIIGTTCKLTGGKGLESLLEVFAGLTAKYDHIRLVITGTGPLLENLNVLAEEKGISAKTVFGGFSDAPIETACAYDIAVLNSLKEGFPNSVVEYMAAGCAVVSTAVGAVPEILRNEQNGLLVEPGQDQALYNALEILVKDIDLRQRLGDEARKTVKEHFSEEAMLDKTEKTFLRVLEAAQ